MTRTLMPVLLAMAVMLTTMPAQASASSSDLDEMLAALEQMTITNDQLREDADSLAEDLQQFDKLYAEDTTTGATEVEAELRYQIESGGITAHLPKQTGFRLSETKVWEGDSGERIAYVPYVGSVVAPSGLTVMLNANGEVARTFEAVYQSKTVDSGTMAVWLDGTLEKYVFIDASGAAAELRGAPEVDVVQDVPDAAPASWWGDFTYCLTEIMAIPAWVISGISIACAVGCAISAGTGCFVCVLGAAAAYTSAVSFCIGWASGG